MAASKRVSDASALPDVSMRAGALVDGDGRVLWSRRDTERRSMASITKIMTAVVALERSDLTSTVMIPRASGAGWGVDGVSAGPGRSCRWIRCSRRCS